MNKILIVLIIASLSMLSVSTFDYAMAIDCNQFIFAWHTFNQWRDDCSGSGSGETNTASNIGTLGTGVFAQKVLVDLQFKKALSVNSNLVITSNSTNVIFNNTATNESTVCTNLGSASGLSEGIYISGNCDFKKLLEGSNIALSSNGTHIAIASTDTNSCTNTGSGEAICESSNNINSLIATSPITVSDTTGDLTIACSTCSTSSSPFEFLGEKELSADADFIELNFTNGRDIMHVFYNIAVTNVSGGSLGTITISLQFNDDTGTNYASRFSLNGVEQTAITNAGSLQLRTATLTIANGATHTFSGSFIITDNTASRDKTVVGEGLNLADAGGDTVSPDRTEFAGMWDNSANEIVEIDIIHNKLASQLEFENEATRLLVVGRDIAQ